MALENWFFEMNTNLTPSQQIYTIKTSHFAIELLANFWTAKTIQGYTAWKVYIMLMVNFTYPSPNPTLPNLFILECCWTPITYHITWPDKLSPLPLPLPLVHWPCRPQWASNPTHNHHKTTFGKIMMILRKVNSKFAFGIFWRTCLICFIAVIRFSYSIPPLKHALIEMTSLTRTKKLC